MASVAILFYVAHDCHFFIVGLPAVMESSRTCPWPRVSSRTHFQVLGLVAYVLGLGLESQVVGFGLGLVIIGQ